MKKVIFFVFISILAQAQSNLKINFPVHKYTLSNGLTVLLAEDHSVPLVSYHTWYRVGSRDEGPGVTGAAHMLEHMMFKGAKKYSGKEFDRLLQANGIVNNAFTSWDYTGFYLKLPSSKLELVMDMEVDRMRFLKIGAEDLKSELEVVKEERRWRIENNPPSLLRESIFEKAYGQHPYHWPVIGYMSDISSYTPEKLRKFYDQFYLPNNAVLVIAGDIQIEQTKKLIEKYYGALVAKSIPVRQFSGLPTLSVDQRVDLTSQVQSPTVAIAYPGVKADDKDSFVLDLIAAILGNGNSSRLYQKMVYQAETATDVTSYNWSNVDPGLFIIGASLKPNQSPEVAIASINGELQKILNQKATERELAKAKNQTLTDVVQSWATIDGKARSLAVYEILFGDYQKMYSDLDEYSKITIEDILRVSKKIFSRYKTVGVLKP